MSEIRGQRRMGQSIGAVLAGILVGITVTIGTDILLHATGVFPPWGQPVTDGPLVLATTYRIIYCIAAGYLTGRLAPAQPVQHALAGGLVGLVVSTVGAVVTWNRGPAFGPHWYPLALIVTAMPCAWAGGTLRVVQLRAQPASSD